MRLVLAVATVVLCAAAVTLWLQSRRRAEVRQLSVVVPKGEPEMEAAILKARQTVSQFTTALRDQKANQSHFQIKVAAPSGHFLWLADVAFDGSFAGTLGPDAAGVHPAGPGGRVAVPAADVVDWMYEEDGKLVGGFTLRAIRAHLSGDALRAFDESVGARFE